VIEVGCGACYVRICAINSGNRFCCLVRHVYVTSVFSTYIKQHLSKNPNYHLSSILDAWLKQQQKVLFTQAAARAAHKLLTILFHRHTAFTGCTNAASAALSRLLKNMLFLPHCLLLGSVNIRCVVRTPVFQ
jgi:hypothetical protein